MEADHSGDGILRVITHRVGAGNDVAVEDDGNTFIVGSGHLLGSEDNGVLLPILNGLGSNDVIGVIAYRHGTSLNFGCHIVVVAVVVFATSADHGQATEEHQT